ncbi:hypothetical protein P3T23_001023 [Paraburkholderia sp. GAS448]
MLRVTVELWPFGDLGLLQDANHLFFVESLFHCRSPLERTLHRHRTNPGGRSASGSPYDAAAPVQFAADAPSGVLRQRRRRLVRCC